MDIHVVSASQVTTTHNLMIHHIYTDPDSPLYDPQAAEAVRKAKEHNRKVQEQARLESDPVKRERAMRNFVVC